jgi:chloramphenicol-sensitive protein RarD
MKIKDFNKGIALTGLGSFWWGVIGVFYFEYISFVGHIEVVLHRCIWSTLILLITTTIFKKWHIFFDIIGNYKIIITLFFSGLLIFINWAVWIYAVASNQIIDASFGYFIMPILSIYLGYFFFKEKITIQVCFSIILVLISIIFLLTFSIKSIPWVGLIVALSWSFYNVLKKKINIDTDIGLLIETLFIFPFALVGFYLIVQNNLNDFNFSNPSLMLLLILAGPMTIIPLFLYVRGVELCGIGPPAMIFYITPTFQFLLGFFYYNEPFSFEKLLSFILIWIAVIIYLKDLYENK